MKTLLFFSAFAVLSSAVLGTEDAPAAAVKTLPPPGPDGMITLPSRTRAGAGYTVSSFGASFWNARDYCQSTGRRLLSIEDSREQQEVSFLLASYGIAYNMWTSGIELTPGELIWASTGASVGYNNIGNTNPSQQSNCLAIISTGANRGKWWYSYCQNLYYFLCEY